MSVSASHIFFDTETGGIGLDKSLLTVYFHVTDVQLNMLDELYLRVKPDDGIYHLTAESLSINKINLIQHEAIADSYKVASQKLYNFLLKHSQNRKIKLVPVGHNVEFDIQQIQNKLICRQNWENMVSYRKLDTQSTAQYLILKGVLDSNKATGSLTSLARYFGISAQEIGYGTEAEHDARYDTLMTKAVLMNLLKL